MAEAITPVSAPAFEMAPNASYETERVREFPPHEVPAVAAASGPGFAPAEPIRIEWSSDLQQVESDPEKVQAAATHVTEEVQAPRPKRVRHAPPPVDEGPLVQVETGRDEKTPA